MQFRNFAENLLGSKVKIKLLRHLFGQELLTSERELARLLDVSHSAINKALKDFHEQNIVSPLRVGNVTAWKVNRRSIVFGVSFENVFKPLETLVYEIQKAFIHGSKNGVKKAVLFGSIAEKREHPGSDIDLMVLVDGNEAKPKVAETLDELSGKCISMFGNKLSPIIFTETELRRKENRQLSENIANGMVVCDNENKKR